MLGHKPKNDLRETATTKSTELDSVFPHYREAATNSALYKLTSKFRRRPEYHESGEILHMEFPTRFLLSFEEMCCLLADYCVKFKQPWPANKYELLDICQAYVIEFGRFKGIDYDTINSSTLYKARVTVAKCLPDYWPRQRVPQWVVVPPEGFSEELVQVGKPRLKEHLIHCQSFKRSPRGPVKCDNLSDTKSTRITDGVTVYMCIGHYSYSFSKGLVKDMIRLTKSTQGK